MLEELKAKVAEAHEAYKTAQRAYNDELERLHPIQPGDLVEVTGTSNKNVPKRYRVTDLRVEYDTVRMRGRRILKDGSESPNVTDIPSYCSPKKVDEGSK